MSRKKRAPQGRTLIATRIRSMKYIVLLLAVVICGCATQPQYLYDQSDLSIKPAILTSYGKRDAKKIIKAELGSAPGLDVAIMYSVNGIKGDTNWMDFKNLMNTNLWDFSFEHHVLPGNQIIMMGLNHYRDLSRPVYPLNFEAVSGNKYYVAHLIKERPKLTYVWTPVVVNLTTKKLVFPANNDWLEESN